MPPKGAKILCDQGVSYDLMTALRSSTPFLFSSNALEGWSDVPDDQLLSVAEQKGFSVLVTTDQNIVHQQNMQKRQIGLVILGSTNNDALLTHASQIAQAIRSITRPGKIVSVPIVVPRKTKRPTRY
jgi:hypothetical protein